MAQQAKEKFVSFVLRVFANEPNIQNLNVDASEYDFWTQLVAITGLEQSLIAEKLAHEIGLPFYAECVIRDEAIHDFPATFVQKNAIAPIEQRDEHIVVALSNPFDDNLIQQINFVTAKKATFVLCSPLQIEEAMHDYFSNALQSNNQHSVLVIQKGHPASTNEHAIVALARKLLSKSVADGASDLHIQPYLGGGEVRERVDGLLKRVALLPLSVYEQLCRYFKAASDMDPSNERITQDGRLSLKIDGVEFELRISTLPAKGGERLVIRFLNQERKFSLNHSGIATAEIQRLRNMVTRPSGIILLTGPTGSGKTTTLYSLLGEIDSPNVNIITIENPVESTIPTISQVDINEKMGLTFSNVLRSVLRQDPDVILLGEIRDAETAKVATQAALTGHLVLSTVHTNDAISAVTRLSELGVDQSIIADALIGVVSQRLSRKLCDACKVMPSGDLLPEEDAFKQMTKIQPGMRKKGCPECNFTGYIGRFPVLEILEITSESQRAAIKAGHLYNQQQKQNSVNSFESIASSAARHIISGDTTVEEVCRVLGAGFWTSLSNEYQVIVPEMVSKLGTQFIKKQKDAVLVLTQTESDELSYSFSEQWFDVIFAKTSQEAKVQLKQQSHIIFVVVDIPDELDDQGIVLYIRQARVDMAWSRLPAILLLPQGKEHVEQMLRDDGAISPCFKKPLIDTYISDLVRVALSDVIH